MEEFTRTQTDLQRTQPLQTLRARRGDGETRSFRLLRTAVFGVAILIGFAALVVILGGEETTLRNPSRLYSPSGHLPGQVSSEQSVSMSWTGVEDAAGYWWAILQDTSLLPQPFIRPSGDDRRVYFKHIGTGYFVMRTAFRVDGRLRWTDDLAYGPIVVRDRDGRIPGQPTASPGAASADENGSESSASAPGGRGGTAFGGSVPEPTPVDPRYAGQPGECPPGADPSQCGGAGQPGQPAQAPGTGSNPGRPGNAPGQPGPDGADGPDGPP